MSILLIAIFSAIVSLLPLVFSGFFSFQATILSSLFGIIFGIIYSRTQAKKYLYTLIILLAIIIVPTSLPANYPSCKIDRGYMSGPKYDCSCVGLIRSKNNREQCVGLRLSCYDIPRSQLSGPGTNRVGTEYMQYGDTPNETEARTYFNKVAKEKYGTDYTGTINLQKELMTKVEKVDGSSFVCDRGSSICQDEKYSKILQSKNYVQWYAQFGINCDSIDFSKYGN